jgi:hypothetical protein
MRLEPFGPFEKLAKLPAIAPAALERLANGPSLTRHCNETLEFPAITTKSRSFDGIKKTQKASFSGQDESLLTRRMTGRQSEAAQVPFSECAFTTGTPCPAVWEVSGGTPAACSH